MVNAFVMIVYRYRKQFLRPVLTDDILVQKRFDFLRFLEFLNPCGRLFFSLLNIDFLQIVSSHLHAVAADVRTVQA